MMLKKKINERKNILDQVSSSLNPKKKKKYRNKMRNEESSALYSLTDRPTPIVVNLEDPSQKVTFTRRSRPGVFRMWFNSDYSYV